MRQIPAVVDVPDSPEPVAVSPVQRVSAEMAVSSTGWRAEGNGARSKVLSGQTIRVTFWDLSAAKASVNLTPEGGRPERFAYVFEGQAEIAVGSSRREIGSNTVAVLSSAANDIQLRSLGQGETRCFWCVRIGRPLTEFVSSKGLAGRMGDDARVPRCTQVTSRDTAVHECRHRGGPFAHIADSG